jgi:3-oxoacid CoA-transferase A subunit
MAKYVFGSINAPALVREGASLEKVHPMDKTYPDAEAAVSDICEGSVIALGGFFSAGRSLALTRALAKKGVKNLTVVVMQMGIGNEEVLELVKNKQIKKAICNYPFPRSATKGINHPFEQAIRKGEIELELFPMGTFVEKLRCAGAGIPAFYTPTGAGTVVAEGKEARNINGQETLLEYALPVDYAFIHAYKGDREGNLVYHYTALNFNNAMAMAARVSIAEVENLVETGEMDSNNIHTPGIFIKRVVKVPRERIVPGID